jgi:hypothetical protein
LKLASDHAAVRNKVLYPATRRHVMDHLYWPLLARSSQHVSISRFVLLETSMFKMPEW